MSGNLMSLLADLHAACCTVGSQIPTQAVGLRVSKLLIELSHSLHGSGCWQLGRALLGYFKLQGHFPCK